jgi:putative exporter of polyketide antibiotics
VSGKYLNGTKGEVSKQLRGTVGIYMVIQEESAILWEIIVCVILSKKVHMNMGPILNGYRDTVKRRYGPSYEHEQQLRSK